MYSTRRNYCLAEGAKKDESHIPRRQWRSQDFVSGVAVSIAHTRVRLKTSSAIANAVTAHRIAYCVQEYDQLK